MNKVLRTISYILFAVLAIALLTASVSADETLTTIEIGSIEIDEGTSSARVPVYVKNNQGIISVRANIAYNETMTLTSVETGELLENSYCSDNADDLALNPYPIYFSDATRLENITGDGVLAYLNFSVDPTAQVGTVYEISVQDGIAYNAAVEEVSLAYTAGKVAVVQSVFNVTFNNWDGTLIVEVPVNKGEAANAPANPTRADADGIGYIFDSWDKAFDNVTSDITVTAQYTSFYYGDVNGDGSVTALDGVVFSRYLAKWTGYGDSSIDKNACDIDKDGKVSATDRVILSRYLAKWTGYTSLPYVS